MGSVTVIRPPGPAHHGLLMKRRKKIQGDTDEHDGGQNDCSFLHTEEPSTIAEALSAAPELAQYIPDFEREKLDPDLAKDLTVNDLRQLLPQAPMGHCVQIRRRLNESTVQSVQLPQSKKWLWPSRLVAAAARDDTVDASFTTVTEFALVTSALFIAFTIPYMLDPKTECADGSDCRALRCTDIILWTLCTLFMFFAVLTSWVAFTVSRVVAMPSLCKWWEDNFALINLANICLIQGISFLPIALGTRMLIILHHPSYPPAFKWIMVALIGAMSFLEWYYWMAITFATYGPALKLRDFVKFQAGVFGMATKKDLDKAMRNKESKINFDEMPYFQWQ